MTPVVVYGQTLILNFIVSIYLHYFFLYFILIILYLIQIGEAVDGRTGLDGLIEPSAPAESFLLAG
jgi:hypothetical protein